MARTIGVIVRHVDLNGRGSPKPVRVSKRGDKQAGPTVAAALAKAGITATRKDLTVNGEPATGRTHLKNGDKVVATERPAGS